MGNHNTYSNGFLNHWSLKNIYNTVHAVNWSFFPLWELCENGLMELPCALQITINIDNHKSVFFTYIPRRIVPVYACMGER